MLQPVLNSLCLFVIFFPAVFFYFRNDNNFAVRFFPFAVRTYAAIILQCHMNNTAFLRIHRFQNNFLACFSCFCSQFMAQTNQSFFPFCAIVFDIDDTFYFGTVFLIDNQIQQELQRIQCIAVAANQNS